MLLREAKALELEVQSLQNHIDGTNYHTRIMI